MNNSSPSQEEWRALYEAAIAFQKLAPWEWMYDSDLFGVQNPEDGEIGYCCIMGNLGEHFALGLYQGTEGLDGYLKVQSGELSPPDVSLLHYQKCLMASFEDRSYLDQRDLSLIKELGFKFRGRNAWPQFRSYLPDYFPWYLTAAEGRFLLAALQQSLDVAQRFQDNPDLLEPPQEGLYLVRVPKRDGAALRWSDLWLAPAPWAPEQLAVPPIDEVRVQRIKRSITARQGTWEADFFLSPSPIQEHKGQRPYYAYMFLWVDRRTGMVMPPELAAPDHYAAAFQNHFLSLIEQVRFLPQEVCVLRQEALDLLDPIAKRLGIKLRRSRRLGALEEARTSFMSFMGQM